MFTQKKNIPVSIGLYIFLFYTFLQKYLTKLKYEIFVTLVPQESYKNRIIISLLFQELSQWVNHRSYFIFEYDKYIIYL